LLYNPQESVPVLEELYFDKIKTLVDIVKLKDFYKKPKLISTNISKISFQINKEVLQNLKEKRA
nr:hypothetical protein [Candidatus Gracilibacteria bacterium]